MSPSYREPSKDQSAPRSAWGTMSIFMALGFLTALMGLLVYGAIQGAGSNSAADRAEIRASR